EPAAEASRHDHDLHQAATRARSSGASSPTFATACASMRAKSSRVNVPSRPMNGSPQPRASSPSLSESPLHKISARARPSARPAPTHPCGGTEGERVVNAKRFTTLELVDEMLRAVRRHDQAQAERA